MTNGSCIPGECVLPHRMCFRPELCEHTTLPLQMSPTLFLRRLQVLTCIRQSPAQVLTSTGTATWRASCAAGLLPTACRISATGTLATTSNLLASALLSVIAAAPTGTLLRLAPGSIGTIASGSACKVCKLSAAAVADVFSSPLSAGCTVNRGAADCAAGGSSCTEASESSSSDSQSDAALVGCSLCGGGLLLLKPASSGCSCKCFAGLAFSATTGPAASASAFASAAAAGGSCCRWKALVAGCRSVRAATGSACAIQEAHEDNRSTQDETMSAQDFSFALRHMTPAGLLLSSAQAHLLEV